MMPTTLPTGTAAVTRAAAAAARQSGLPTVCAVLPAFEQQFVEVIATAAASAGKKGSPWEHFSWELDMPEVSLAAIAHRSVFGPL